MSDEPTKKASEESAEAREMTQEQLLQERQKQMDFYNDQLPFLRVLKEFQDLGAGIEEAKARKLQAIAVQSRFMSQSENQNSDPDPEIGEDGFPKSWTDDEKAKYIADSKEAIQEMEVNLAKSKSDQKESEGKTKQKRTLASK